VRQTESDLKKVTVQIVMILKEFEGGNLRLKQKPLNVALYGKPIENKE